MLMKEVYLLPMHIFVEPLCEFAGIILHLILIMIWFSNWYRSRNDLLKIKVHTSENTYGRPTLLSCRYNRDFVLHLIFLVNLPKRLVMVRR